MTPVTWGADLETRRFADELSESTAVVRPRRSEVVRKIRDEAKEQGVNCNRERAEQLYMMLDLAVTRIRRDGPGSHYQLTGYDLTELHPVLEAIMPDDMQEPIPGSAHDLVNRHFIQGDEFAIVHTRVGADLCCVVIATHNI